MTEYTEGALTLRRDPLGRWELRTVRDPAAALLLLPDDAEDLLARTCSRCSCGSCAIRCARRRSQV